LTPQTQQLPEIRASYVLSDGSLMMEQIVTSALSELIKRMLIIVTQQYWLIRLLVTNALLVPMEQCGIKLITLLLHLQNLPFRTLHTVLSAKLVIIAPVVHIILPNAQLELLHQSKELSPKVHALLAPQEPTVAKLAQLTAHHVLQDM